MSYGCPVDDSARIEVGSNFLDSEWSIFDLIEGATR